MPGGNLNSGAEIIRHLGCMQLGLLTRVACLQLLCVAGSSLQYGLRVGSLLTCRPKAPKTNVPGNGMWAV